MKKIIFGFVTVLFASWNFEAKAQCPPSMPLLGGDTNYVYHNVGVPFGSGTTRNCNDMPFYIWANQPNPFSNPITDIFTPCIRTDYTNYWTTARTSGTETFYEGGTNIGCVGPSLGCSFPIGGTVPPPNGTGIWDLYFSYLDPTLKHDMVFSKTAGAWNTFTTSIQDCWSFANLPATPANPVVWAAQPSYTMTTAANTPIGFCSFTLAPAVAGALTDLKFGYCYVRPRLLPAGTYTVTYFFSGSKCPGGTTSQFIFTIANPYSANWTVPTNLCSNGACVSLPPTVSGTAGGTWSGTGVGGTQFCPSTSGAGTFPVTYTVGISPTCGRTQTNNITVTATPTISISGAGPICSGQSITLTGGTAAGYTWSPAGGNGSSATVTPGATTTYTLTGANGVCTANATAIVNVTATPTMSISGAGTICSGSSIVLTGGTAGSYTWGPSGGNGSSATVSPGTTTTYTLTGANGVCTASTTATVNVTPTPTMSISGAGTICAGGSITLIGGTAAGYTWSPAGGNGSSATVSPGTTTTYTLTGANAGCTSTAVATVNVTPNPTVGISSSSGATICSGQTTTLTASGATNYTWSANAGGGSTPTVTVSPTTTTTYSLTGSTSGCNGTQAITINVTPTPTVTAAASSPTICVGKNTVLTGGGAANYTWMPGGSTSPTITVSPGSTTTYTVTGNTAGCTATQVVTVNVNPLPVITLTATPSSLCVGQTTTITAGGASTYTWSANAGSSTASSVTVTPASTSTYTVNATGANGCTNSNSITVNVGAALTVTITASQSSLCSGQTTTLTASGATNYTWSPGGSVATTLTVTPGGTTTYTLLGTSGGCQGSQTVTVNVTALPNVIVSAASSSICAGQSTLLTGSGATTYTWSANAGSVTTNTASVSPVTTTIYTVTGTANGCTNTNTVSVTVIPTPTVAVTASSGTICAGQSTTLNGSGATNYTWMPGGANSSSINVSPSTNTTYTVVGATAGCISAQQTVSVLVNPTPTVSGFSIDSSKCGVLNGGVKGITVSGGTPGYTYQWYNGSTPITGATSATLSNVGPGTYSVLITDASGCVATGVTTFTVPGSLAVSAAITPLLTQGQAPLNVTFTNSSSGATIYTWNFGNGSSSTQQNPGAVTYSNVGTYTVTMIASNGGCLNTTSAIVIVDMPTSIVIPNIFSPNGDGINDEFYIVSTGLRTLNCDIFNRWGQRMFTLMAPQQVWDGKTPAGEKASDGTYYYILTATGLDGKQHNSEGSLTLVR